MKYILSVILLLSATCVLAQPKVIQGAENHLLLPDIYPYKLQTSADGKLVAIGEGRYYNIINTEAQTIERLELKTVGIHQLASNFESSYGMNCCYPASAGPGAGTVNYWSHFSPVGQDPAFVYRDSLIVIGAPADGKLYVTSSWKKQVYSYGYKTGVGGYKGLWAADPKTGKLLKQLRSDTLVFNDNQTDFLPLLHFTSSALIAGDNRGQKHMLRIMPFNSDSVYSVQTNFKGPIKADDNYLYTSDYPYTLEATDLETGKTALQVTAKGVSPVMKDFCEDCGDFLFADNAIYRFNRTTGDVKRFVLKDGEIKETGSWKAPVGKDGIYMIKGQNYITRITAGPSLLVLPQLHRENDNDPGNEAFLVDLNTGTLKLKIAPFFHLSPEIKAFNAGQREKDLQAAREREAAKRAELAKKEAACAALFVKSGKIRGTTYRYEDLLIIMDGYDCEKGMFVLWRPRQPNETSVDEKFAKIYVGPEYQYKIGYSRLQYHTCSDCDGDGYFEVTEYTTKTKDLPWGYFSGIETKKITTTSTTKLKTCTKCDGFGIILR